VGYAEHDGQHGLPQLRGNEETGNERRQEESAPAQQFEGAGEPIDVSGVQGCEHGGEAVADANSKGLQRREQHGTFDAAEDAGEHPPRGSAGECCEAIHHTMRSGQSGQHGREESQMFADGRCWAAEPGVGRVVNGLPNRVDRLKCLGNAVVPQQAYPIFKALKEELNRDQH
jgi:hypothetical protein